VANRLPFLIEGYNINAEVEMKVGRLLLRISVGGFFFGHGTQKLFGWFGGQGLKETGAGYERMGLRPAQLHATAAGTTESAGGAALALGYQTPFASAALITVMLTAINRVHLKNGPWAAKGGYEYNAVLIAAAAALAESGPGRLSLDALRGKEKRGGQWSLLALVLGTAGAAGAHFLAERQAAMQAAPTVSGNGSSADIASIHASVAAAADSNGIGTEQDAGDQGESALTPPEAGSDASADA